MAKTIEHDRFLGIPWRAAWRELGKSWRNAAAWPWLRAFTPALPVAVVNEDGSTCIWDVDLAGSMSGPREAGRSEYVAVALPSDMVLHRRTSMPLLDGEQRLSAVALEARASSPFPEEDLCWGHHVNGPQGTERCEVEIVLASRRQVAAFIAQHQPRLEGYERAAEVWAPTGRAAPPYIVLQGFGEEARAAQHRRGRALNLATLGLAGALLVAIAMTPTIQLRARAIEAVHAYDDLAARAQPAVASREALVRSGERLEQARALLEGSLDPAEVLRVLTRVLPDDTSLTALRVKGRQVSLEGRTTNAAELMQILSRQPGFEEVVAPAPATRAFGSDKDIFKIDFLFVPGQQDPPQAPSEKQPTPAAGQENTR